MNNSVLDDPGGPIICQYLLALCFQRHMQQTIFNKSHSVRSSGWDL